MIRFLVVLGLVGCGDSSPSGRDAGALPANDGGRDAAVGVDAGRDGASGDSALGEIPYEEFAVLLAQAGCDALEACYGDTLDGPYGGCVPSVPPDLPLPDDDGLFPGGRQRYDASRAGACLAAIAADPCGAHLLLTEGCDGVFVGLVEDGEVCAHLHDCQPGSLCTSGGECPLRCVRGAVEGEACESRLCAIGLSCGPSVAVCRAHAGLGESCEDAYCREGLYCLADTVGGSYTCRARVPSSTAREGESCNVTELCEDGLACVLVIEGGDIRNECMAPVARDARCYSALPSLCPEGQWCDTDPASTGSPGTCTDLGGVDDPCPGGNFCEPSLRCVLEVCRDLAEIGDPCDEDLDCHDLTCIDGTCASPRTCR